MDNFGIAFLKKVLAKCSLLRAEIEGLGDSLGERCDRCLRQKKGAERVAAVCVQRRRTDAKAPTGNRNRTTRLERELELAP